MTGAYRAALIGLGKIGVGYAADPLMAKHYPYATHAQGLRDHPRFDWVVGMDTDSALVAAAQAEFGFESGISDPALLAEYDLDVAILATPPGSRAELLAAMPKLSGLIVEKPLGRDLAESRRFIQMVEERRLPCQVALWRRSDVGFRELAQGKLEALVGQPQAVFATYGNGLRNNGTHVVDFLRMLFGEIGSVLVGDSPIVAAGPIPGDRQFAFQLTMESGLPIAALPLDFGAYREVGLDIWGTSGRLAILQEGLTVNSYLRRESRSTTGEYEIDSDHPIAQESTVGTAFYAMLDNLAATLDGHETLNSPIQTAYESEQWVEKIWEAAGCPR